MCNDAGVICVLKWVENYAMTLQLSIAQRAEKVYIWPNNTILVVCESQVWCLKFRTQEEKKEEDERNSIMLMMYNKYVLRTTFSDMFSTGCREREPYGFVAGPFCMRGGVKPWRRVFRRVFVSVCSLHWRAYQSRTGWQAEPLPLVHAAL